jgi:hypothetical protein
MAGETQSRAKLGGRSVPESTERTRAWSKERIEDVLSRERFDYQKVSLPFGLHTRGHERDSTARLIFPDSLSGKSVLDVGSSLGFFASRLKSAAPPKSRASMLILNR